MFGGNFNAYWEYYSTLFKYLVLKNSKNFW